MPANNSTSLKQLIQQMYPDGPSIVEGSVLSVNPLKITLVNDSKMVLGVNSLIVPQHLSDYTTKVDIQEIKGATMTVYNALKAGDEVYLFVFNNGKKYYVMDKKG